MSPRKKSSGHELDAADRNAMPDTDYAFPSKRKEPLTDATHVRNAIARFDQVEDVTEQERREAFGRIQRAANKFGVQMSESSWRDLGGPVTDSPAAGRSSAKKSTGRGRGGTSRDELYAEAARRNIKGRSAMTKQELERALRG